MCLRQSFTSLATMAAVTAAALISQSAQAAAITQTHDFLQSSMFAGSGTNVSVFDNQFFKVSLNPFDAKLGTLTSFGIGWSATAAAKGVIGLTGGGSAQLVSPMGGTYTVNGAAYAGDGFGNGDGGGPLTQISFLTSVDDSREFSVSPFTYNPAILAAITGTAPVTLAFTSPLNVNFSNFPDGLDVLVEGKVTLTYNYTAAPSAASDVPEPASLALVGIALLGVAGTARRKA